MANISKEDIILFLIQLENYCEGAIMASDDNRNLHSFAYCMQKKISSLTVELKNGEME